ncbi:MAG TPA: metallophosphoesterase, partial [Polyangiaceae bacterium]
VFTIAVIPDTQNYVDYTKPQPASFETFKKEMSYLAANKSRLNLAFVTHVGDVVQHGDGTNGTEGDVTYGAGSEWDLAREAMSLLAVSGVPFGMSPGNHDYDNYSYTTNFAPLVSNVMWKSYFGSDSSFFRHKSWYGGASDELAFSPGLSSFQVFEAGNKLFLHISLEMEAGDAALAWAQSVINSHKGYATIVTTHAFIDPPADDDDSMPLEVPAERIPASTRYLNGSPGGWNDAQGVWDKFISKNDQIFMVLSGHAWGASVNGVSKSENLRIDLNKAAHPVYQLLSDYQGNKLGSSGGDGWLRLMEFDTRRNSIHFITYSPVLNKYAGQDEEYTFNQAPEFSDFELPMPVQVVSAKLGVHACAWRR